MGGWCGLFYFVRNIVKIYACGLGIGTNNYVKRFVLYLGLKLSLEFGVSSLIVIEDSPLVLSQTRLGK